LFFKALPDGWTVVTGITDNSHGHQCDGVREREKIVVGNKDGIGCGGVERSEAVDENNDSDRWMDGGNVTKQLAQ
jgi:hypothetical protein